MIGRHLAGSIAHKREETDKRVAMERNHTIEFERQKEP
jgi:hypothetical protein